MEDGGMKKRKSLHVLVVGGTKTGKSSTINALTGENVAPVYEEEDLSTEEIAVYDFPSLKLWDTPGFGENIEKDERLSHEIEALLKEFKDGKDLIDIVLVVGDASSRDMGTEYNIISKILLPSMNQNQRLIFALNQCDFAMKGKNWDEESNMPNATLKDFLQRKAESVHERLKESTGINVKPICYSAMYSYNMDALLSSFQDISMDSASRDRISQLEKEIDASHISLEKSNDETKLGQMMDDASNAPLQEDKELENQEPSVQADVSRNSATQECEPISQEQGIPHLEIEIGAHREMDNIYERIRAQIMASTLNESDRQILLNRLNRVQDAELNIMIVGGTGVGKSSTINALFGDDVAKVGYGVDPQTNKIEQFRLGKVVLWDTPGLGDSPEHDKFFSEQIIEMLHKKNSDGTALIDVVLVVLDASMQDMGTAYTLINDIVIPNLGNKNRILITLNQCDFAMKGKYWDHKTNTPKDKLITYLENQLDSIHSRIKDSTGVDVYPIYYSALYRYNIAKLFFYLLESTPDEKRLIYLPNLNQDVKTWDSNDKHEDYHAEIQRTMDYSAKSLFDETLDKLASFARKLVRGLLENIYRICETRH